MPHDRYALSPLYNVMSIWPVEGNGPNQLSMFKAKMAMSVLAKKKHYFFKDIQHIHFNRVIDKFFLHESAGDGIEQVLANVPGAIDAVTDRLSLGFPEWLVQSIFA